MKQLQSIESAAVLGAGAMGAGIAQVLAQAGISTRLYDLEESLARQGLERIALMLDQSVCKRKLTATRKSAVLDLLTPCWNLGTALKGADLVIEAAPEQMALKQDIFRKVVSLVGRQTLLATNTSSLSVTELAQAVAHPERFLGLHFFNPPPLMALLEVVRGQQSSDDSVARALKLAEDIGKTPIVVQDSPGFASSRLGVALGLEAMRMVEEGVATAVAIDTAMELGYRHPMGPLKLSDMIGLDVRLQISDYLAETLDAERFRAPDLMRQMVAHGHLGRKSGQGFYLWEEGKAKPLDASS